MQHRRNKEDYVLSQTSAAVARKTASGATVKASPDHPASSALLAQILTSLDDDKAEEVVSIPLTGKSEMADYMVICSGRSSRQVAAIAQNLTDNLKQNLGVQSRVEGQDVGDWVLIDAGDVVVHVFRPEVREFYQLEKMWMTPGPAAARA